MSDHKSWTTRPIFASNYNLGNLQNHSHNLKKLKYIFFILERNWVFATNANFIIPKSPQPDNAYLSYFKLTLFDSPEFIVWNIYGLRHLFLKKLGFKNPSLWQKLIPLPKKTEKSAKFFRCTAFYILAKFHLIFSNFIWLHYKLFVNVLF